MSEYDPGQCPPRVGGYEAGLRYYRWGAITVNLPRDPSGSKLGSCERCRSDLLDEGAGQPACDVCEVFRCVRCQRWIPLDGGGGEPPEIEAYMCDDCFDERHAAGEL